MSKAAFATVCGVSTVTAMGNTGMLSVLPAVGRSIGIPDALVAAIFSLSALLWAFTSPVWARASDRRGRKPLIMLGLCGFVLSMSACAAVVAAGLHGLAAPMTIFVLFLFARALFGLFGSASNPASQAYVAERTPLAQRTQSLSSLAGAFGLGTVVGPFLAPVFVLPVLGLAGPMVMFALIGVAMLVEVWRRLPEASPPLFAGVRVPEPGNRAVRPPPMWRDPRMQPFLIYSFVAAVCQTSQGQIMGFLIIDKLGLTPAEAQGFIAIAMMFGAVAGLLAQWGLIRMFEMTPRQLLRDRRAGQRYDRAGAHLLGRGGGLRDLHPGLRLREARRGGGFVAGGADGRAGPRGRGAGGGQRRQCAAFAGVRLALRAAASRAVRAVRRDVGGPAGLRLRQSAAAQRRADARHPRRHGGGHAGEERRGRRRALSVPTAALRPAGGEPSPATGSRRR
jgi:MFS family permease